MLPDRGEAEALLGQGCGESIGISDYAAPRATNSRDLKRDGRCCRRGQKSDRTSLTSPFPPPAVWHSPLPGVTSKRFTLTSIMSLSSYVNRE